MSDYITQHIILCNLHLHCFCKMIFYFEIAEQNEDGTITTDMVQGFVHSVNVDINELTNQNKCK